MSNSSRGPFAPLLFAGLLLALGASCHDHGLDDHPDEHDHDEVALQVTVWGSAHEIFLEHPPLAARVPARFLIHVTDHRTGEPRSAGALTLVFGAPDGTPMRVESSAPARDGIYLLDAALPSAGRWTLRVELPGDAGPETIALPDALVYADAHDAAHAEAPAEPDGIAFLKEQQWRLGTRIAPVERRAVREHLVLPAQVRAAPERRAHVSTPLAGALLAVPGAAPLAVGRRVEAGELLAYVRPPLSEWSLRLLEAQAELERARIELEHRRRALERMTALVADRARSQRELEEATFQFDAAAADQRAAAARVEGLGRSGFVAAPTVQGEPPGLPVLELRAPISGTVIAVSAAIGEHVEEARSVVELLDPSVVHVEVHVRPDQLTRAGSAGSVLLRRQRTPAGEGELLEIRDLHLLFDDPAVDPITRSLCLVYEAQNLSTEGVGQRLRVGMALEALLPIGGEEETLAVPLTALVDVDGQPTVYVQLAGELFEARPLRLGARDGRWVQVLAGLEAGERIAIEGAYAVRLASASGSVPAHHH